MRGSGWWCLLAIGTACGGSAPDVWDASTRDGASASDAIDPDPFGDATYDAYVGDTARPDAGCEPFTSKTCDGGCPAGTVCIRELSGMGPPPPNPPPPHDLGCLPIPASCMGTPSCKCTTSCACTSGDCFTDTYGIVCDNSLP